MRILTSIALLLISSVAIGEGWVPIKGRNSLGQIIWWDAGDERADPQQNGLHRYFWGTVGVRVDRKTIATYEKEPCEFIHEPIMLACDAAGKSPLAGTKYIGKPINGSCEKGDPKVRYRCVEGCKNNSRAPKEMTQDYWEC